MSDELDQTPEETKSSRRRRNAKERLVAEQEAADLHTVLSTPEGLRLMWRILGMTEIFNEGFHTNALTMARYAGRRSIGLQIIGEITPEDYLAMQAFNMKKEG